jgi:hypothetical protein
MKKYYSIKKSEDNKSEDVENIILKHPKILIT